MGDHYPASVHLRRLLPLIAVVGLLAPGTARAAAPAPDQPPAGATIAPDPAPTPAAHSTRKPLGVTTRVIVAPSRTVVVR